MATDFAAKPTVRKNFLSELINLFGGKATCPFDKLEDLDFAPIAEFWTKKDEERRNRPKEEKKVERDSKAKLDQGFAYAIVDGRIERVTSYLVEPPGIFRGRGEHPLAGVLKRRVWPDDVTINVGEENMPPICRVPGMAWKQVVHKNEATWLANYKDNKSQNTKYLFLDATSKFKADNDQKKYEKARKLKSYIEAIRKDYMVKMREKGNNAYNQLGTATYLIDKLALRVGNEKGEDEADTVGCCSLRVEHVKFPSENTITLDFLAKDSMPYHKTVEIDSVAFHNLQRFTKGKKPTDDLFDGINVAFLDSYYCRHRG